MWWLAAPTTTTSVTSLLLLRRFSSKSCRALTSFTTTTFNSSSSSKFGGGGTFILHHHQQAANNFHTTTTTSSSYIKFGTIILQTNEPSAYGGKKDDIKMFMLSSGSDDYYVMTKKKKVFKLDEDLGFSALCNDFQLQDSVRMVGSCNGIICLHDPEVEWPQPGRDVYLWNPATKHFRILPESIHIREYKLFQDFVGFGLDVETQDYKVLRITPFVPYGYLGEPVEDGCRCRVQVYSLSTDSWKLLDGIDSLPLSPTEDLFGNRQGTYLDGTRSCFFLGSKPITRYGIRDLRLLSFDFTKEIFTIMGLPADKEHTMHKLVLKNAWRRGQEFNVFKQLDLKYRTGHENDGYYKTPQCFDIRDDLRYLGNELTAFKTPQIDFAGGYVFTTPQIDFKGGYWYYYMWVLSEQNRSRSLEVYMLETWSRLHKCRIKISKGKHPYAEPRCVSNDREFALISTTSTTDNGRKKLMLFNIVTGKAIKDFTIGRDRDCRAAYVYNESQVSIMGGGNALLRWQLPTHGTTYKLNLDAPFTHYSYCPFGIGLCLTSDTGGCIGVRSQQRRNIEDAKEGEAIAMLEAIKWAKELELSPIIIESDSKNMVSFFMEDDDDKNLLTSWSSEEAHSILKDAKLLLKSSENNSISFQYCSRSCNYVAEIASKLGSDKMTTWSYKDWTANFPGEVVMSLSKDLGLETARKCPCGGSGYVSE